MLHVSDCTVLMLRHGQKGCCQYSAGMNGAKHLACGQYTQHAKACSHVTQQEAAGSHWLLSGALATQHGQVPMPQMAPPGSSLAKGCLWQKDACQAAELHIFTCSHQRQKSSLVMYRPCIQLDNDTLASDWVAEHGRSAGVSQAGWAVYEHVWQLVSPMPSLPLSLVALPVQNVGCASLGGWQQRLG